MDPREGPSNSSKSYFEILVDTLLGRWVPSFRRRPKRRGIRAPKFYFVDVGVVNRLARRGSLSARSELYGKAFENWVCHELTAYLSYGSYEGRLSYWRLASGIAMSADDPPATLAGPMVVDASTLVEYLLVSRLTESATRLFHLAADGRVQLWAPDLVYPEATSALRELVRLGAIPGPAAERAVAYLPQLPVAATGTAALVAAAWRMREFLTAYDACYVALADALDAAFVTGEQDLAVELRKQGEQARHLGDL